MSRRDQIRMDDEEIERFLAQRKTIILCSNGRGGYPHPVPMWFSVGTAGAIHMTTYRKSQKVLNLRRDSRATLLAESGEDYAELKGVQIFGHAEVIDDREQVIDTLIAAARLGPGGSESDLAKLRGGMAKSAEKRVLIRVTRDKVVSWDHTKLRGAY